MQCSAIQLVGLYIAGIAGVVFFVIFEIDVARSNKRIARLSDQVRTMHDQTEARAMEMDEPTEPLIHSNREYVLPDNHPWARKQVHCSRCGRLVHAFNNECMQTWVEGMFPNQDCELSHLALCVVCFAALEHEPTRPNLVKQWFPPEPHEMGLP